MFDEHKKAILMSGTPYISAIEAGRGYADGETIPVANTDWAGESLVMVVSEGPGQPSLMEVGVSLTTEQKTWQEYLDECVPAHYVPCGADLNEPMTTTLMTVAWDVADLAPLPSADTPGQPINLYLEIKRGADAAGPRFAAGDFILTESVT